MWGGWVGGVVSRFSSFVFDFFCIIHTGIFTQIQYIRDIHIHIHYTTLHWPSF